MWFYEILLYFPLTQLDKKMTRNEESIKSIKILALVFQLYIQLSVHGLTLSLGILHLLNDNAKLKLTVFKC